MTSARYSATLHGRIMERQLRASRVRELQDTPQRERQLTFVERYRGTQLTGSGRPTVEASPSPRGRIFVFVSGAAVLATAAVVFASSAF